MNKCRGCGAILQTLDVQLEGYTKSVESRFCERCFRIKNYNEYKKIEKDGEDFLSIVREIGKKSNLVIFVIDLFQVPKDLKRVTELLSNPILLVLTKRDLLPASLYEQRLIDYFNGISSQIVDTVIISSKNNYHFDELMQKIKDYQNSKEVYVVGYTNAGKSSMVNKILEDYTEQIPDITTSMLPSTTVQEIEIKVDENLVLVDTPGLLEEGSLVTYLTGEELKKAIPRKTVRPIVYQIKEKQSIFIDKFVRIDCEKENNLVFYFSNLLPLERVWKSVDRLKHLNKIEMPVAAGNDVVIKGLGFFKVMKDDCFQIYVVPGVDVYTRKSLI